MTVRRTPSTVPDLPLTETITTSQTWTHPTASPSNPKLVYVVAVGGGGKGGNGGTGTSAASTDFQAAGGGGGGGGGVIAEYFLYRGPLPIVIGAVNGGTTTVATAISAPGGSNGSDGTTGAANVTGFGGAGGNAYGGAGGASANLSSNGSLLADSVAGTAGAVLYDDTVISRLNVPPFTTSGGSGAQSATANSGYSTGIPPSTAKGTVTGSPLGNGGAGGTAVTGGASSTGGAGGNATGYGCGGGGGGAVISASGASTAGPGGTGSQGVVYLYYGR